MTSTEADFRGMEFQNQLQDFINNAPESLKSDDLTLILATWIENFNSTYIKDQNIGQVSIYAACTLIAGDQIDALLNIMKSKKYSRESLAILYIYCAQLTK